MVIDFTKTEPKCPKETEYKFIGNKRNISNPQIGDIAMNNNGDTEVYNGLKWETLGVVVFDPTRTVNFI